MFKDIGYQIIVKWKLWKLLVTIYPLIMLIGYGLLFNIANMSEISEIDGNQMIKSQTTPNLGEQFSNYTESYYKQLKKLESSQIEAYILDKFNQLGLQTYVQQNQEANIIGRFRAKRSPNYECFVISFEYDNRADFLKLRNIAFILSLIKVFQGDDINYFSRDIIFVAIKSEYENYGQGIKSFLKEYIHPNSITDMPRSGTIRQALHFNLEDQFDSIVVKIFGLNGRVPDRDYFLNFNFLMESSGIKYTYFDNDYSYLKDLEVFLTKNFFNIYKLLQLDQLYVLPKNFINIYPFYAHVIDASQGDIHGVHSYFYQEGVHALTVKGYNKKNEKDQIQLTKKLSLVTEGAVRGYMAMDEYLYQGSTMYLPVGRSSTLTIQKYTLPLALLLAAYVIQNVRDFLKRWHFNIDGENKKDLAKSYSIVLLKEILLIQLGISLCFVHQITQFGISQFNLTYDYYDIYFSTAVSLFIIYLSLVYITRYYYFNQLKLPRTQAAQELQQFFISILFGLCLIYAAIINLPIGLLMASLVGPFLLTVRPIFRISNIYTHYFFLDSFNIYNILSYLINIGFMIYIYYFVEFVGIDKIKDYLFNIINDQKSVSIDIYYYMNVVWIPFAIRLIDLYSF